MPRTSSPQVEVHDESAFVAQLRSGNQRAFERLILAHHEDLVRLARNFVRHEETAREVAQDVWLAVFSGLPRFEGRSTLKTWITRITVNIAKTRGAREKRSTVVAELDDQPASDGSPEAQVIDRQELARVLGALSSLPARQAVAVVLHHVEGLDTREVSHLLGVSETNLRVLHHRARSKLRQVLDRRAA